MALEELEIPNDPSQRGCTTCQPEFDGHQPILGQELMECLYNFVAQLRVPVVVCMLACLLGTAVAPAKRTDLAATVTLHSQKHLSGQRSAPVSEWFRKYDGIRSNAEMTLGDKLQSFMLAASKPQKRNAALASRMIKKYTIAASELNTLQSIPETRELQAGYTKYFIEARQLFVDYLEGQKAVPFTNQSLIPVRKKLEELDKRNKRLDGELRRQYRIKKHKHS